MVTIFYSPFPLIKPDFHILLHYPRLCRTIFNHDDDTGYWEYHQESISQSMLCGVLVFLKYLPRKKITYLSRKRNVLQSKELITETWERKNTEEFWKPLCQVLPSNWPPTTLWFLPQSHISNSQERKSDCLHCG